jgi:hypothetical protein
MEVAEGVGRVRQANFSAEDEKNLSSRHSDFLKL